MVKLYHRTQLHSQGSNSKPLVKLGETTIISPTCVVRALNSSLNLAKKKLKLIYKLSKNIFISNISINILIFFII